MNKMSVSVTFGSKRMALFCFPVYLSIFPSFVMHQLLKYFHYHELVSDMLGYGEFLVSL